MFVFFFVIWIWKCFVNIVFKIVWYIEFDYKMELFFSVFCKIEFVFLVKVIWRVLLILFYCVYVLEKKSKSIWILYKVGDIWLNIL